MSEKIDWSDLENIEPVPGGDWDGWKIVAHYQSDSDDFPHLVVVQDADGRCAAETFTDDGRDHIKGPLIIRNKAKRVTLEECWVVYDPDGQHCGTWLTKDSADNYAAIGCIVRHIPAETIEV